MSCIVDINGEQVEVYGNYNTVFDENLGRFIVDNHISMNSKCRLDEEFQSRFDDISRVMYRHLNLSEFPPCKEGWMETFEYLKSYFSYDNVAVDVLEVFYYTFERLFMLYSNDINASFWGPNHDYFEKYEV